MMITKKQMDKLGLRQVVEVAGDFVFAESLTPELDIDYSPEWPIKSDVSWMGQTVSFEQQFEGQLASRESHFDVTVGFLVSTIAKLKPEDIPKNGTYDTLFARKANLYLINETTDVDGKPQEWVNVCLEFPL